MCADLCLADQLASENLKTVIVRCVRFAMKCCRLEPDKLLHLWALVHNSRSCSEAVSQAALHQELIFCLRDGIRLSRTSFSQDGFLLDNQDMEMWESGADPALGKRPRVSSYESMEVSFPSKLCCTISLGDSTSLKVGCQAAQTEHREAWFLELALVDKAIKSGEAIESMNHQKHSCEYLAELRSAIMVLDASSCPLAWTKILVRYFRKDRL